jgi:hypothetical protein
MRNGERERGTGNGRRFELTDHEGRPAGAALRSPFSVSVPPFPFVFWPAFIASLAACGGALRLEAPNVAPSAAREPTRVDLDPIAPGGEVEAGFEPPGPAAVLTAAMGQELAGRALSGGEPGGYQVRCTLDRFAVRSETNVTEGEQLLALYADLSCEARRAQDGAVVWRGELRGRACEKGSNVLGSNVGLTRTLATRALADASREMASDLALRALGLQAAPSVRVFADEAQQRALSGLDDTPWGPAALQENGAAVERALRSRDERDAILRAAAWNVVAMAAGPGEPWRAGESLALDDDALVRFVQYKALARHASPAALAQLRAAAGSEGDAVVSEMLPDAVATGGLGVMRTNAIAVSRGTSTRP